MPLGHSFGIPFATLMGRIFSRHGLLGMSYRLDVRVRFVEDVQSGAHEARWKRMSGNVLRLTLPCASTHAVPDAYSV